MSTVYVSWYTCDCDWHTKYCDENHSAGVHVPKTYLESLLREQEAEY